MRGALAWWLSAFVVWSWTAPAAEPDAAAGRPRSSTRVEGTVPDLVGRWLVVTQVRSGRAGAGGNGTAQLWEVGAVDGRPELVLRDARLPPALQASLAAANQAARDWEPPMRELQMLRDAWSTLPSDDRGVAALDTVIMGRDAFTEAIVSDEQLKGADFVIQISVAFTPGPNRPIKDVLLFGVTATTPLGYAGNSASASIAPTPVPIPIVLKGVFRLYRLESVPTRGVLARIVDAFTGCGRATAADATARLREVGASPGAPGRHAGPPPAPPAR